MSNENCKTSIVEDVASNDLEINENKENIELNKINIETNTSNIANIANIQSINSDKVIDTTGSKPNDGINPILKQVETNKNDIGNISLSKLNSPNGQTDIEANDAYGSIISGEGRAVIKDSSVFLQNGRGGIEVEDDSVRLGMGDPSGFTSHIKLFTDHNNNDYLTAEIEAQHINLNGLVNFDSNPTAHNFLSLQHPTIPNHLVNLDFLESELEKTVNKQSGYYNNTTNNTTNHFRIEYNTTLATQVLVFYTLVGLNRTNTSPIKGDKRVHEGGATGINKARKSFQYVCEIDGDWGDAKRIDMDNQHQFTPDWYVKELISNINPLYSDTSDIDIEARGGYGVSVYGDNNVSITAQETLILSGSRVEITDFALYHGDIYHEKNITTKAYVDSAVFKKFEELNKKIETLEKKLNKKKRFKFWGKK